jgi:hypothetical protein
MFYVAENNNGIFDIPSEMSVCFIENEKLVGFVFLQKLHALDLSKNSVAITRKKLSFLPKFASINLFIGYLDMR